MTLADTMTSNDRAWAYNKNAGGDVFFIHKRMSYSQGESKVLRYGGVEKLNLGKDPAPTGANEVMEYSNTVQ